MLAEQEKYTFKINMSYDRLEVSKKKTLLHCNTGVAHYLPGLDFQYIDVS